MTGRVEYNIERHIIDCLKRNPNTTSITFNTSLDFNWSPYGSIFHGLMTDSTSYSVYMSHLNTQKNALETHMLEKYGDTIKDIKSSLSKKVENAKQPECWGKKKYKIPTEVVVNWKLRSKKLVKKEVIISTEKIQENNAPISDKDDIIVVVKASRKKRVNKSMSDNIVVIVDIKKIKGMKSLCRVGRLIDYENEHLQLLINIPQDTLSNNTLENALSKKFEVQSGIPSYYVGNHYDIMNYVMKLCMDAIK